VRQAQELVELLGHAQPPRLHAQLDVDERNGRGVECPPPFQPRRCRWIFRRRDVRPSRHRPRLRPDDRIDLGAAETQYLGDPLGRHSTGPELDHLRNAIRLFHGEKRIAGVRHWPGARSPTAGRARLGAIDINGINAIIDGMANITIRGLDPELKERLRIRAARHGRSMEEEARVILREAIAEGTKSPTRLADSIRRRFQAVGGVELELPEREPMRDPPRPR
jgi:plasmid stability protein